MKILIVWGIKYKSTAQGSATVEAECEACGIVYYYAITRRVTVSRTVPIIWAHDAAQTEASDTSSRELQRELRTGLDPVACPACGHLQMAMVRQLRQRRALYAVAPGLILGTFFYAGPFGIPTWIPTSLLVLSCMVAVALVIPDPNRESRRARNRATTLGRTKEQLDHQRKANDEAQLKDPEQHWKCPRCGSPNLNNCYSCRKCRYSLV